MASGAVRPLRPLLGTVITALAVLAVLLAPATAGARGLRLGDRVLATGATGPDVRELQRTLARLGFDTAVNGTFERTTAKDVARYERRWRLAVDGVVGRGEARGMRGRAGTLAFAQRTLRRGSRGRDVRRLQNVLTQLGLRSRADGVFGSRTERLVRRYEKGRRIRVDGVVSTAQARAMIAQLPGRSTPVAAPVTTPVAPPGTRRFPIAGAFTFAGAGGHFRDRDGRHMGADVLAACGTPIVAVENGSVVFTGSQDRAGNYVVLRGAESAQDHVYMHLAAPAPVVKGAAVGAGQTIGAVGRTGNASACLLHFELWTAPGWYRGGAAVDPLPSLQAWAAAGTG